MKKKGKIQKATADNIKKLKSPTTIRKIAVQTKTVNSNKTIKGKKKVKFHMEKLKHRQRTPNSRRQTPPTSTPTAGTPPTTAAKKCNSRSTRDH